MKRRIVHIDRSKCNGCGLCVDACHEGAIQMVDGKAELVSDIYCDGLGDCLGECPTGAITIEERDAEAFDPAAVASRQEANGGGACPGSGCPGMRAFQQQTATGGSPFRADQSTAPQSRLGHWPVQLSLVPVQAPWWDGSELLLVADCVPVALPAFHSRLVGGRGIALACPKLDDAGAHAEKLAAILAHNRVRRVIVARMSVPCCSGLVRVAEAAVARAGGATPIEVIVVDHNGQVLQDETRILG